MQHNYVPACTQAKCPENSLMLRKSLLARLFAEENWGSGLDKGEVTGMLQGSWLHTTCQYLSNYCVCLAQKMLCKSCIFLQNVEL